jgi:hypothetical protein
VFTLMSNHSDNMFNASKAWIEDREIQTPQGITLYDDCFKKMTVSSEVGNLTAIGQGSNRKDQRCANSLAILLSAGFAISHKLPIFSLKACVSENGFN